MSDFEDADFCVETWTLPPNTKRKKDSKKNDQRCKNTSPVKTQASSPKVKKRSKLKEAALQGKERKKEKRKDKKKDKKKKNKLVVDLTQASSSQANFLQRFAAINKNRTEKLNPDRLSQDSGKEAKRKKHVAFGLLPSYVRAKRPHFVSLSPKEAEVVSRSQVTPTGPHDDFQGASDDVNSQDLFITQKTFRASPSSSDTSDGIACPRVSAQRDRSQEEVRRRQRGADRCSQEPKREETTFQLHQWEKWPFQTQMKFKANLPKQEKESEVVNPYLDEPFVINPTPDAASCLQHVSETPLLPPCTATSSTQTENFFTTELSLYLDFCRRRRAAVHAEDPKPWDLSLPWRARKDLRVADPKKTLLPGTSASPRGKPEGKTNLSGHSETTPSPQSEPGTKSADATASSEDDHFCRSGRRDLVQVGAVQLRLNKTFFFKTKGERTSPRPESPLTKLSQGRDVKSKKHR